MSDTEVSQCQSRKAILMPESTPLDPTEFRRRALARWDNEGGAITTVTQGAPVEVPQLTNTELVQLRVRVIALENMLIAVLAEGTDRQMEVAREMAAYIAPRPSSTAHPLTVQAAHHMTDLIERSIHFRTLPPQ